MQGCTAAARALRAGRRPSGWRNPFSGSETALTLGPPDLGLKTHISSPPTKLVVFKTSTHRVVMFCAGSMPCSDMCPCLPWHQQPNGRTKKKNDVAIPPSSKSDEERSTGRLQCPPPAPPSHKPRRRAALCSAVAAQQQGGVLQLLHSTGGAGEHGTQSST